MARPKKTAGDLVAERLSRTTPRVRPPAPEDMLSTGCTLLNLAVAGNPTAAIPKGTFLYVVGDSGTMKTWMAFCLFAEAARNPHFAKHRFVFDNAENGALMDVEKFFGPAVLDRLEPPHRDRAGSRTVQEFYYHVELAVRRGPCIYVLDSMDAPRDEADGDKFDAEVRRYETGKGEVPGSMGMAKARTNSRNIAHVVNTTLRSNGSILVAVSQTRDKPNAPFPMKTRGGGHALKFYAHVELWTKIVRPLNKTVLGVERHVGDVIRIDVRKNRVSGWEDSVDVRFAKRFGVDDTGTLVQYLFEEGVWDGDAKTGGDASHFGVSGSVDKVAQAVEDSGRESELVGLAAGRWADVLAASAPARKPRY